MKFARTQLACAALAVLGASVIAGCGSDVPSGSVAKVGDATIKKADFDKWLKSAAQGSAQGGDARPMVAAAAVDVLQLRRADHVRSPRPRAFPVVSTFIPARFIKLPAPSEI